MARRNDLLEVPWEILQNHVQKRVDILTVYVWWVDAASCDTPPLAPLRGFVVGMVAGMDDMQITIAREYFEDNEFRAILSIPRGGVLKMWMVGALPRLPLEDT